MVHQRGGFILFEGLDRSGKTTQSRMLAERLRQMGKSVTLMNFPASMTAILHKYNIATDRTTQIGQFINGYLKGTVDADDRVIHLLFSANRWEAAKRIKDQLNSGTTIVMDRYAFSGVAFSSAKGLDMEWCKRPDVGLPAPDKVIFLDLDPEQAVSRGEYGEERYEKKSFQIEVRNKFHLLKESSWKVMDATKSIEELANDITAEALRTLDEVTAVPLGDLWT